MSMKKIFALMIILFSYAKSFSQEDTSKVEQYCEVVATPRLLSTRVTIDIDYGEERSIWRDTRLKEEGGRLKKFNSVIDALNYMARDGWRLVNAFPVNASGNSSSMTYVYHYVFKKSFLRSEISEW